MYFGFFFFLHIITCINLRIKNIIYQQEPIDIKSDIFGFLLRMRLSRSEFWSANSQVHFHDSIYGGSEWLVHVHVKYKWSKIWVKIGGLIPASAGSLGPEGVQAITVLLAYRAQF